MSLTLHVIAAALAAAETRRGGLNRKWKRREKDEQWEILSELADAAIISTRGFRILKNVASKLWHKQGSDAGCSIISVIRGLNHL